MAQPIEDEYGIVTENARRRSVFSKYIERRVEDYLTSPGGRARLAREIESRVKVEVDALIARKAQERVAELERATNVPRSIVSQARGARFHQPSVVQPSLSL